MPTDDEFLVVHKTFIIKIIVYIYQQQSNSQKIFFTKSQILLSPRHMDIHRPTEFPDETQLFSGSTKILESGPHRALYHGITHR